MAGDLTRKGPQGPQVACRAGDTLGTSCGLGTPRRSQRRFRWALTTGSSASLGGEGGEQRQSWGQSTG